MYQRYTVSSCMIIWLIALSPVLGDWMVFQGTQPSDNTTVRSNWLAAIGIAAPASLVDFESGFTQGQSISGVTGLFPDGMVVTDVTNVVPARQIIITGQSTSLGGSSSVGSLTASGNDSSQLLFDFSANPISYFGFLGIDHNSFNTTVTFVGGTTRVVSLDGTGASGNTAEFTGMFNNDLPLITSILMSVEGGDGEWGFDNLEYGRIAAVPEPTGLILLVLPAAVLARRRCRGQSRGVKNNVSGA